MKIKKLAVLIMGTMFFWNLHAALITHLKFEDDFEDSYGDINGKGINGVTFAAGISKDTNEAFEVGGNGESLGKSVNSISFVFRPRINGVPVFIEDISVEYDAGGLYQIRSRVPYSVSVVRTGIIKTKNEAVAEMSEMVKIEEAEKGNVVYTLDENDELILSYVTKDEEKREFKTISLEAKNE